MSWVGATLTDLISLDPEGPSDRVKGLRLQVRLFNEQPLAIAVMRWQLLLFAHTTRRCSIDYIARSRLAKRGGNYRCGSTAQPSKPSHLEKGKVATRSPRWIDGGVIERTIDPRPVAIWLSTPRPAFTSFPRENFHTMALYTDFR